MIPSAESIQRGQKLVGDFIEQTQGKPITLALSRLGILAALAIHEAVEAERWACERDLNPSKWLLNIPHDKYREGFIDGLRAAHERISARLETGTSPVEVAWLTSAPSDAARVDIGEQPPQEAGFNPSNSPDPLSEEPS